jgi:hypothetical protein
MADQRRIIIITSALRRMRDAVAAAWRRLTGQ